MQWKKIEESEDLIRHELVHGSGKDELTIFLEARLSGSWEIFVKYRLGSLEHVESFKAKTKAEALKLIRKLKAELQPEAIRKRIASLYKPIELTPKRVFKDYYVEKWSLTINRKKTDSFMYILFEDSVIVDIVLDKSFSMLADKIVARLKEIFDFDDTQTDYNIYYYTSTRKKKHKKPKLCIGKIEMDISGII